MAIDLRSDTVTRPTDAMRAAMAAAEVGDDVYGEDPTVNALEAEVAAMFGHEAALFTPTGSMANQIALQTLVPPANELLCDADAHVVTYEIGAAAAFGGISTRTWPAVGCRPRPRLVGGDDPPRGLLRGADPGDRGRADPQPGRRRGHPAGDAAGPASRRRRRRSGAALRRRPDLARPRRRRGAAGHLRRAVRHDVGLPVQGTGRAGRLADGLHRGTDRAGRMVRKRMGGGMRQAGILAAAGLYALAHHLDRLADDHARARRLAEALAPFGVVEPSRVRTNIVLLDLTQVHSGRSRAGRTGSGGGRARLGDGAAPVPADHPPGSH